MIYRWKVAEGIADHRKGKRRGETKF